MNFEFYTISNYGQFIWPAFIFTFAIFFTLYYKTKKELKLYEKNFHKEFNIVHLKNTSVNKKRKTPEGILSGKTV